MDGNDTELRIGIIGGNGWIGGAVARALVGTGLVREERLTLSCRSTPPDWLPEAHWTHDNQALADRSDVIILSVRPQDWPAVAAGTTLFLIPICVFTILLRKHLLRGITFGAVRK